MKIKNIYKLVILGLIFGFCLQAEAQDVGFDEIRELSAFEAPQPVVEDLMVRQSPKTLKDYDLPGLSSKCFFTPVQEKPDIVQLIYALANLGGIKNLVIGKDVTGQTSKVSFNGVTVGEALEVVLSVNNLAYEIKNGIITIMTDAEHQVVYGSSFYDRKKVEIVKLKRSEDAARVMEMLSSIKSTIGTIVGDQQTGTLILIDTPRKTAEMRAVITGADIATITKVSALETRAFVLQYADVTDLQKVVSEMLSPVVGKSRPDVRTKTLMVTDVPDKLNEVADLVAQFDRSHKEVFIEAKIIEIRLNDTYRMGIDWTHVFHGLDPRFSLQSAVHPSGAVGTDPNAAYLGATAVAGGTHSLTYQTIMGAGDLKVIVEALSNVGDTKILSNPHVTVLDGEEATIKTVREQPYAEAEFESGSTNVIGETIIFVDIGVTLNVKPVINDDGFITMMVKPSISTLTGQYQAMYDIPVLQKSETETSVMIKDGRTLIIAGMIQNERRDTETGVPILRSIPLFGALFRSKGESVVTSEIVVFLTPRIITGEEPVLRLRDAGKTLKPLRDVGEKKEKPIR